MADQLLYRSGAVDLHPSGRAALDKVAGRLASMAAQGNQADVVGNTDNVPVGPALAGRCPSNWELAGARAAVVGTLPAGQGRGPAQMQAISNGEYHPVAPNDSAAGPGPDPAHRPPDPAALIPAGKNGVVNAAGGGEGRMSRTSHLLVHSWRSAPRSPWRGAPASPSSWPAGSRWLSRWRGQPGAVRDELPAGDRCRDLPGSHPAGRPGPLGQRGPARRVHGWRERLRATECLCRHLSGGGRAASPLTGAGRPGPLRAWHDGAMASRVLRHDRRPTRLLRMGGQHT